jgi:Holliday junction resolvase RusA-like endonuclease
MIKLIIYGQTPSKKTSQIMICRKRGRPLLLPNKKYMEWQSRAIFQLKEQKQEMKLETICEPIEISFQIYRLTKRKIDLSNLIQSCEDALVKASVIKDDFLIENLNNSKRILDVSPGEERVEIYILPVSEGSFLKDRSS